MRTFTVILVGVSALTVGAPAVRAQLFGSSPVAIVNGENIPRTALDEILKQRPPVVTPLTGAQQRQIKDEIVAMLVDEALIRQFLKTNAQPFDPAEVGRQIAALEKGLATQGKTFADYLKETKQTDAQVRANVTAMLQWNAYALQRLTETDLLKYYGDNKDFFDKTTVRASHIVLRALTDASPGERDETQKKLAAIRNQIASGQVTFAEAAIKNSQCPSASTGGDLGFVSRKWMVEEPFARAAFALKVGELSNVVTTDYGFHLIQVTERKMGEATTFDRVKEDVRDSCTEDLKITILMELRRTAKIEIKLP